MSEPLTDEERSEIIATLKDNPPEEEKRLLLEKLEQDIENFVNTREKRAYKEGWSEETFLEEMENHPAFMTKMPEPGEPLPPLVEALQQLKYSTEENTPQELAANYKEDGNYNFKAGRYQLARFAYTEGLQQQHDDTLLKVQLYTNRAASQYYLQNYRSSLEDCKSALKLKPDHLKALVRSIECCLKREKLDEALDFCEKALSYHPTEKKLKNLHTTTVQKQKKKSLEDRMRRLIDQKESEKLAKVLEVIKSRGIRLEKNNPSIDELTPEHPAGLHHRVCLDEDSSLIWPVMFLYPEYGESDFIQEFHEDSSFSDHLETMFGEGSEAPPWDPECKYRTPNLRVYYDDVDKLHCVKLSDTLRSVLCQQRLVVKSGTPAFVVLVEGSDCQRKFLKRYVT